MRWRPLAGFEGLYEISDTGMVRALERMITDNAESRRPGRIRRYPARIVASHPNGSGYLAINLRGRRVSVHRAVLLAFGRPPPGPGYGVNHLDGDKSNNRVENLVWATATENNRHARLTRLNRADGERCHFTIHRDKKVEAIRLLWPTNRFTQADLAELFGVSATHVAAICRGSTRKTSADP